MMATTATTAKQLEQLTDTYEDEAHDLRAGLVAEIRQLPDNPRINRASTNPNCFTMNMSDVGTGPWSAEYHDFKAQHKMVADAVEACASAVAISRLRKIVRDGKVATAGDVKRPLKLHPDVVRQLRVDILGETPDEEQE